jgi:putative oxidoreductase
MPMFDTKFVVEPIPNAMDRFRAYVPALSRLGLGLLFVLIGYSKLDSNPRGEWVRIFEQIGLGQWFRYLTAALQVLGGILVLFPQTLTAGAAMLACTMLGATFIDAFVLHMPFFFIPFFLFVAIAMTWVASK